MNSIYRIEVKLFRDGREIQTSQTLGTLDEVAAFKAYHEALEQANRKFMENS